MKVILLMLICALYAGTQSYLSDLNPPAQARAFKLAMNTDHKTSITFTGTVKSIELLGKRELEVTPVDLDPKFAVTVHLESVTPPEAPIKEGADVVFAIHSPARLFRGGEGSVIGKKYHFKVIWEQVNNRSRFSRLAANPIT